MNTVTLAYPLLVPSIETIFDKPVAGQRAHITKYLTNAMTDIVATDTKLRHIFGHDIADASLPYGTRIANVVIRRSTRTDGDGTDAMIPVTCACPNDAPTTNDDNAVRLPIILYFHSGGLIAGSVKADLHFVRYLASKVRAVVCSVEYRLAPDFPFPAGLNDAVDASVALISANDGNATNPVTKALEIGVDTSRIVTFGLSAGGHMSAHVARLLTQKGHDITLQVSLVPMVKPPHGGTKSIFVNWNAPFWNGLINSFAWSVYLPGDDGSLANNYRVSLLVDPHDADTIRRLPPVYMQINTKDVLRDEGKM